MTTPLKHVAALNRRVLPESTDPDFTFRYLEIGNVNRTTGVTVPNDDVKFADAPSRARRLARVGDTVVSTVRTYLRAVAEVPASTSPLVFSTGFAVLEPTGIEGRFLVYACQSDAFINEVVARSAGVSYPAIAPEELLSMRIWTPDVLTQRRIADFLDDRVSRIDRIIAARRQQIDLVRATPWLEFSASLNSTPEIPVRRAIASLADGPFGSAFSSADYVDIGPAVIRLGNIGFGEFRSSDLARVPETIYRRFPQTHVRAGDLLVASLGDARNHAGRACLAPDALGAAMVKGKCFRGRAAQSVASEGFLAVLLSSPVGAAALVQQGTGATRSMLNFERLLSCCLPIPSRADQEEILRDFRSSRVAADDTEEALVRSIELLTEYKSSLITAAVTGELDVTTAGSNIPG